MDILIVFLAMHRMHPQTIIQVNAPSAIPPMDGQVVLTIMVRPIVFHVMQETHRQDIILVNAPIAMILPVVGQMPTLTTLVSLTASPVIQVMHPRIIILGSVRIVMIRVVGQTHALTILA